MQDAKRVTAALSRLLATFPPFASGDARTALQVYYEVIAGFDDEDIEAVVGLFIAGQVEGQSLTYLPTAPMFAAQLRGVHTDRASADAQRRKLQAQIEAREREAAEREPGHVRAAVVQRHLARLRIASPPDEAAAALRARMVARMDEKFLGRDGRPASKRLGLEVGGDEARD